MHPPSWLQPHTGFFFTEWERDSDPKGNTTHSCKVTIGKEDKITFDRRESFSYDSPEHFKNETFEDYLKREFFFLPKELVVGESFKRSHHGQAEGEAEYRVEEEIESTFFSVRHVDKDGNQVSVRSDVPAQCIKIVKTWGDEKVNILVSKEYGIIIDKKGFKKDQKIYSLFLSSIDLIE